MPNETISVKHPINIQGPVARSLVSANLWLRGIKMYRFPWYLTLVSTNHASSNPGYILQEVTLSLSKDFVHYFPRSRSGQVHSLMSALTCVRSVDTNLTLITCPSPKSFVCNLPDSGRHVTSVSQGLSLARFVGRVRENPGDEVGRKSPLKTRHSGCVKRAKF